jgi:hypothetical protein
MDRAARVASHREPWPFDRQRVQPQLAREQRAPGHHRFDGRQHQSLAAFAIKDAQVGYHQARPQAVPVGLQAANSYRQAHSAGQCRLHLGPVVLHLRQQPEAQREKHGGDGEEDGPRQRFQRAQQHASDGGSIRGLHRALRCPYSRVGFRWK